MLSRREFFGSAVALGAAPFLLGATNSVRTFGVGVAGLGPGAVDEAEDIAGLLGKRLDVVNVFESFAWQRPLPVELLEHAAASGATVEVTWEPWNPNDSVDQPDYSLEEIAGGRHDDYLSGWAADSARFGERMLIRFCHEMNGNWYPWSVYANGGSPDGYVAAFRHVRQLFNEAGASRVEWVWSPNVILSGDTDAIEASYPGADYVDVIGIDGYNFGAKPGHAWTPPAELFLPTIDLLSQIDPGKPLWINEVGSNGDDDDKFAWWAELVEVLTATRVSALLPFQVDKKGNEWRITNTPEAVVAARKSLDAWQ